MDDAVAVRLTPAQAKHIAASMRIALAARFEGAWAHPLPDRADVEGLRALVNSYADELAMLEWGEPQRDVELLCQRVRLERLARELIEAGTERIDDQPIAGREGRDMISAAQAINAVLARERIPAAGARSAPKAEGRDSTLAGVTPYNGSRVLAVRPESQA